MVIALTGSEVRTSPLRSLGLAAPFSRDGSHKTMSGASCPPMRKPLVLLTSAFHPVSPPSLCSTLGQSRVAAAPAPRALVDRKAGAVTGEWLSALWLGGHRASHSVQQVLTGRRLRARLVPSAVAHTVVLSHEWKTQRSVSSYAGIQQPRLVSPREGSAFLSKHHLFFKPERGSGGRDLSPHTTQALGKDMRTLGSFHEPWMRWQDMETPEVRTALTVHGEWLGPAFQQRPPQRG